MGSGPGRWAGAWRVAPLRRRAGGVQVVSCAEVGGGGGNAEPASGVGWAAGSGERGGGAQRPASTHRDPHWVGRAAYRKLIGARKPDAGGGGGGGGGANGPTRDAPP